MLDNIYQHRPESDHTDLEHDCELLRLADDDDAGLNVASCADFLDFKKLPNVPCKVLLPDHAVRIARKMRSPLLQDYLSRDIAGFAIPELALCVAKRDTEDEVLNGDVVTTSVMLEEKIHSVNPFSQVSIYNSDAGRSISFRNRAVAPESQVQPHHQSSGEVKFEEAYAAMICAEFVEANRPDDVLGNIREHYGDQATENTTLPLIHAIDGRFALDYPIPMPIKFGFLVNRGDRVRFSFRSNAFLGYALELLCKKKPELSGMLYDARLGKRDQRDVMALINDIDPLIARDMNDTNHSVESYISSLDRVIQLVTGGDPRGLLNLTPKIVPLWQSNFDVARAAFGQKRLII